MRISDWSSDVCSSDLYNYVRDGANQALNRFVAYLLRQGAAVRVYSPTTDSPAFEPAGDLVSAPSVPVPGRREYGIPYRLSGAARRSLRAFLPKPVPVFAHQPLGHTSVAWVSPPCQGTEERWE